MSFSVLALLGWNGWSDPHGKSSLPTYVLPFVIVVVGAENMSTLVSACFLHENIPLIQLRQKQYSQYPSLTLFP